MIGRSANKSPSLSFSNLQDVSDMDFDTTTDTGWVVLTTETESILLLSSTEQNPAPNFGISILGAGRRGLGDSLHEAIGARFGGWICEVTFRSLVYGKARLMLKIHASPLMSDSCK